MLRMGHVSCRDMYMVHFVIEWEGEVMIINILGFDVRGKI